MIVLELEFETESKKKATLSIENPVLPIDESKVQKVMDDVITSEVFTTKNGKFVRKLNAQVITRTVENYPIA